MKVIAKKDTKRIVKGCKYDVIKITGDRIFIKIGTNRAYLSINNFTTIDGKPVPQNNWTSPEYNQSNINYRETLINDVRLLKKGDIVVGRSDTKKFTKDKMYKVADIYWEEIPTNWGSKYTKQKIKIEGYNRWLSTYGFRLCTAQEKRNISLGNIFGDDTIKVETDFSEKFRKIDTIEDVNEKNKAIISCIASAILDPSKNSISTLEWAVQKRGKDFGLTMDDIKPFLNKKLSDLVKFFD